MDSQLCGTEMIYFVVYLQQLLPEGNLLVNSNLDAVISSLIIRSQVLLPASHCFIIGKDLICQLVHKLIKAQIHLGEKKQRHREGVSSTEQLPPMHARSIQLNTEL